MLIAIVFGLVLNWPVTCPHDVLRHQFELNVPVSDRLTPNAVVVPSYLHSASMLICWMRRGSGAHCYGKEFSFGLSITLLDDQFFGGDVASITSVDIVGKNIAREDR